MMLPMYWEVHTIEREENCPSETSAIMATITHCNYKRKEFTNKIALIILILIILKPVTIFIPPLALTNCNSAQNLQSNTGRVSAMKSQFLWLHNCNK